MQPFIGITGNEMQINRIGDVSSFHINYSARHFSTAVEDNGGVPFLIPITKNLKASDFINRLDGLLLVGGQDVTPYFYGEEPRNVLGQTSPERDEFEIALIQEAIKQNKPILAICRGMQLVNVVLGGNLLQDISENPSITIQHVQQSLTQYVTHSIQINPISQLFDIAGRPNDKKIKVNSFHHQVIKELGNELIVSARSPDNVIEAIESATDDHDIIGVQWHPEYLTNSPYNSKKLFSNLVERALKRAKA